MTTGSGVSENKAMNHREKTTYFSDCFTAGTFKSKIKNTHASVQLQILSECSRSQCFTLSVVCVSVFVRVGHLALSQTVPWRQQRAETCNLVTMVIYNFEPRVGLSGGLSSSAQRLTQKCPEHHNTGRWRAFCLYLISAGADTHAYF